jgi:hypothetical protein
MSVSFIVVHANRSAVTSDGGRPAGGAVVPDASAERAGEPGASSAAPEVAAERAALEPPTTNSSGAAKAVAKAAQQHDLTSRRGITGTGPWGNYIVSVVLIGLVPLFPIMLEGLLKGEIFIDSLTLTATIYAVTVAIASCNLPLFVLGFCVGILECALYAQEASVSPESHPASAHLMGLIISSEGSSPPSHDVLTAFVVLILFLCVVVERFLRHVREREVFLEFMKAKN